MTSAELFMLFIIVFLVFTISASLQFLVYRNSSAELAEAPNLIQDLPW